MADHSLFHIPSRFSFVDALAQGVLDKYGDDPLGLSELLILLPNQRTVKSLRDAFLRISGGKAIILPVMRPIGNVDEDQLMMEGGFTYSDGSEDEFDLPPAISPFMRQMILMDITHRWSKQRGEEEIETAQRATLAHALGGFLDQVQSEELDFEDLEDLVPENYAIHWQATLDFLKILTHAWPDVLLSTGHMDSAHRQNHLIKSLCENWLNRPPQTPIIIAGSTGVTKALRKLIGAVCALPKGIVVLPGFDVHLDDISWETLNETHPQFALKRLLEYLDATSSNLRDWTIDFKSTNVEISKSPQSRSKILTEIMRPSATSDQWRNLPKTLNNHEVEDAFSGMEMIVTSSAREEAGVIAMIMRDTLETTGKTAALVTPDRQLARRVQGEMNRWGIAVDDSAGTPLYNTRAGLFLRLTAQVISERFAPVALLSVLKHPLTSAAQEIGFFRRMVRKLDKNILRGTRPNSGSNGILQAIVNGRNYDEGLKVWWDNLSEIFTPFENIMAKKTYDFSEILTAHIQMAEQLCAKLDGDTLSAGEKHLWRKDDGEAAAKFIEEIHQASEYLGDINPEEYAALLETFMTTVTVRAKYGQHPRLNIWGPLEGRLQHADLVILAGLNEGVWPPEPPSDPWMSRPMRREFGLPSPEEKIGISAHDFIQSLSAPNVILTRSEKTDGTPTVKSRWLSRMDAVLGAFEGGENLLSTEFADKWTAWYSDLDAAQEPISILPPEPKPPVENRPRKLSVTDIQNWMKDPYSLYAKRILNLRPLDDIDMPPGASDKGTIIHDALDEFMQRYSNKLPHDATEKLVEIGREKFEKILDRPSVMAFWWPRFVQIAQWFVENEKSRRALGHKTLAVESSAEMTFKSAGGPFTILAKADRIDQLEDGSYSVIDYKTGRAPTAREIYAGYAPQLPLESILARGGYFAEFNTGQVSELAYWKLSGGKEVAEIKNYHENAKSKAMKMDVDAVTDSALEGLMSLVATFDLETTPYLNNPRPDAMGYGEYDHLARTKEWANRESKPLKVSDSDKEKS